MSRVLALSKKPRTYIPVDFRGTESPPTFTIRSISRREHMKVLADRHMGLRPDQLKADGQIDFDKVNLSEMAYQSLEVSLSILSIAILSWANLTDQDGESVPFSTDNIELLDETLITELVQNVTGAIGEKDLGNSGNPSSVENGTENKQMTEKNGTAETVENQATTETETANQ